jgi:hypothetical protein
VAILTLTSGFTPATFRSPVVGKVATMEESKDQIKKVQISDLEKPQDDASKELDRSQLDKISGGGEYSPYGSNDGA